MTIEKNAKWVSPSPILPDEDLHFVEGGHCLSLANHIKVWIVTLKSYPGIPSIRVIS